MKNLLTRLFMNEKLILIVIIVNSVVIFLEESNINSYLIEILDIICTSIFVIEMFVKIGSAGFKNYWKQHWNKFDFILVLISIPTLVTFFLPTTTSDLSSVLIMRVFRVFRFFRSFRIFPDFGIIVKNFWTAMHQTLGIFFCFFIMIAAIALVNCCFLKTYAPEYFGTPMQSIYSTFRICTVEGWYEIPDAVAVATSPIVGHIIRIYFCLLLISGGIIGLSFINSIFVDAMVSDNNDDVKTQLTHIESELYKTQSEFNKVNKELTEIKKLLQKETPPNTKE